MNPVITEPISGRQVRPSLLPQTPAWDKNIEELVLGCLLLNNKALPTVVALLRPEDFYLRSHQKIFAAVCALYAENVPADPFTVGDHLRGDDDFEGAGGRDYLLLLAQLPVAVGDARRHAEILKRTSIERTAGGLTHQYLLGSLDLSGLTEALGLLHQETTAVSPVLSVRELYDQVPPEPAWIVKGLLAREAITDLAAKIKLGKTHFALSMIAAILAGTDFLGFPTTRTNVLYLTEERQSTFTAACRRVGISPGEGFHILLRSRAPRDWASTGALVLKEARRLEVGLVAVDTLSDWAALGTDEENDAGAALAAMRPLQTLAGTGIGILDLRHDRKGVSSDLADSARGSSAFGGAADILLGLRPAKGAGHPNRRLLMGQGRFDGIPPELTVELVDGQYVSLGEGRAIAKRDARESVLRVLPERREEALSANEVEALCPEIGNTTLKETLRQMADEGLIGRDRGLLPDRRAYGHWRVAGGAR
jgi:DnaB-like helicase N terminal domain/AAA domain